MLAVLSLGAIVLRLGERYGCERERQPQHSGISIRAHSYFNLLYPINF